MKILYSLKAMKLSCNKIKKLVIFLCIFTILGNNFAVFAGEMPQELLDLKASLEADVPKVAMDQCRNTLVPIYDIETLNFFTFLETNFQNKSSDSSLINIAIARYSEYKEYLNSVYNNLTPKYASSQTAEEYEVQFDSYELCYDITLSYIDLAKQQMIMHIKNNVAQKKTTILLEKYKAIGEKLRDLNTSIAEMYSLFVTFRKKLPFFIEDCQ